MSLVTQKPLLCIGNWWISFKTIRKLLIACLWLSYISALEEKECQYEDPIPCSNTLATSCKELTHWKRPWCWERLGAGGEGDNRGWDGWMASLTQWTWVWINSRSWWRTGRPGVLRSMGSQRVRHDWATELTDSLLRLWLQYAWSSPATLVYYKLLIWSTSISPFFWEYHLDFLWGTTFSFRDGHISHRDLTSHYINSSFKSQWWVECGQGISPSKEIQPWISYLNYIRKEKHTF